MDRKTIYASNYKKLVKRLRARREEVGLSQAALASALRWPQQRVSAVEAGARRLDVLEYFAIAEALGLTRTGAMRMLFSK